MIKQCFCTILVVITLIFLSTTPSFAVFTLSSTNSFSGESGSPVSINDLQINGTGTEPIDVKLYTTSGTLSMSTTTGLTFDGSISGSEIYFSGSQSDLNTALATLTYTKTTAGTDTLEVSLVPRGEVFFSSNGHLYEFISGSITANAARTAATGLSKYGSSGYLATITSQEENDFVADRLQGDGWMGASDAASEGDWKWLDGPESGTSFWSGASAGTELTYANWSSGEPNDYNNGVPGEDCAQFYVTNGLWNDLPCTGTTLSGYVVEYGAPGDLPTVVAKDITLTINPAISSLSPADDSTGVAVDANIVITFNESVTVDSGNILIKKSSDDTTIQTIDVTSGQVTGGGSATITINPSSDLDSNTEYYITVPNTAFEDGSSNYFTGISSTTAWSFTTVDTIDPGLSNITASSITNNSATITWDSDENSSSQVTYGTSDTYGDTTAETDTSPRVTSHSVNLSSLLSCTTYHYTVTSIDGASNTTTSSDKTFTTTGCDGDSSPSSVTTNSITSNTGGTTSLNHGATQIDVETQADFTDAAATVIIQVKAIDKTNVLNSIGRPSGESEIGDIVFDVKAIINETTVLESFDSPVTITYQYSESDLGSLDESSLWLYHYTGGNWVALDDCNLNVSSNTISCTTPSFSIFGLFGSSTTTSSSDSNNSDSTSICSQKYPYEIPELFQIDVNDTQATLFFTPLMHDVTDYYISYGYDAGDDRFGVFTGLNTSTGVLSYTVNALSPQSTYYFKIRAHNDCVAGEWSQELKVTTSRNTASIKKFYKYSKNPLASLTHTTSSRPIGGTQVLGETHTSRKQTLNGCQYRVQTGDSLWEIAEEYLGSGFAYNKIVEENKLNSNTILTNQILNVGCNQPS